MSSRTKSRLCLNVANLLPDSSGGVEYNFIRKGEEGEVEVDVRYHASKERSFSIRAVDIGYIGNILGRLPIKQ